MTLFLTGGPTSQISLTCCIGNNDNGEENGLCIKNLEIMKSPTNQQMKNFKPDWKPCLPFEQLYLWLQYKIFLQRMITTFKKSLLLSTNIYFARINKHLRGNF